MTDDDDDDYMSDKFLTGCVTEDIRPGLIKSHSDQRNLQILKRKREQDDINRKKKPNIRTLELEKRKEGLEKPIEQSNKGFAMLEKMGYKPGTSLGSKVTGRVEPIPIKLKADREGLGRSQARKEIYEKHRKEITKNVISVNEYRSRMIEKEAKRQSEGDFRKSQRICERLDVDNNILEPVEKWYWFSTDPDNEKKTKKKLRQEMNRRNNDEDMETSEIINEVYSSDEEDSDDENLPEITLGVNEKLWDITTYLRNKYFHCVWCSVQYNDDVDLKAVCPGRTRDVH